MDLATLKPHEDVIVSLVDRLPRLQQWIALGYLAKVLGARNLHDTSYQIIREYEKMVKESK